MCVCLGAELGYGPHDYRYFSTQPLYEDPNPKTQKLANQV